jgi:hypothetical protein
VGEPVRVPSEDEKLTFDSADAAIEWLLQADDDREDDDREDDE